MQSCILVRILSTAAMLAFQALESRHAHLCLPLHIVSTEILLAGQAVSGYLAQRHIFLRVLDVEKSSQKVGSLFALIQYAVMQGVPFLYVNDEEGAHEELFHSLHPSIVLSSGVWAFWGFILAASHRLKRSEYNEVKQSVLRFLTRCENHTEANRINRSAVKFSESSDTLQASY